MKLTGTRATRFITTPQSDIIGVLLFGPNRGLAKERANSLAKHYCPNPDDAFSATILTADDLTSDPAKLADEMSALSMFGDTRFCLLYTSPSPRDATLSRMPSSA